MVEHTSAGARHNTILKVTVYIKSIPRTSDSVLKNEIAIAVIFRFLSYCLNVKHNCECIFLTYTIDEGGFIVMPFVNLT